MGTKINKSEINKEVFTALNNIYGRHLKENTFLGIITASKAKKISQWKIKRIGFLEFQFSNPNFFDIYMQEHGIKPQIIKVKNKKFLRFKKPTGRKSTYRKIPGNIAFEKNGYIYAKMVYHPGFEGRRFIEKMMSNQELWDRFSKQISVNIDKLVYEKEKEINDELNK